MADDWRDELLGPFPGRPEHPDFMKLSNLILKQDGLTEDQDFDFDTTMRRYIDPETITYVAMKRAQHMLIKTGLAKPTPVQLSIMAAVYFDAFLLGCQWGQAKS